MDRRCWRRATLAALAGAAALVTTSVCLDAGTATAAAPTSVQEPLPLPTLLPLPSPSLTVSLPPVNLPTVTLPPIKPPTVKLPTPKPPTVPSATPSTGPTAAPGTTPPAAGTPPRAAVPGPPGDGGSVVSPAAAGALIGADPGADLYPQPPVDAADTPQARRVAALTDVQHRIQYLHNVLARTRDDLTRVRRDPDPVLQLMTALTTGADPDPAPPFAVADSAEVVDTPAGHAVALSGAIASGEAELTRREREEAALRQEIDRQVRAVPAVAAPARGTATAGGGSLGLPLRGRLTSRFGTRLDPYFHVWQLHPGVDLAAPVGTPIVAAADGRVTRAGWYGGYGNYTCLDHGRADGQRLSTCYGHQSRLLVSVGQRVRAGQVIGLVGSTGASTGPHLHFEVRLGGRAVDPLPWL
ncbi:peptidoglycan DD-metalloendopeptidase family protein [Micromonospora sp. 4G57]|uniref:Peptidoglycan DD-metalloendopeptidase family protein n=1 Tax=Micromonospora sicca TaxID=2202420 RepID=A0ABU5J6B5_9ACTN|nr:MULTISPECIES: peptidoglycan DD-metalloendopeptidase family protein [unclassified Micromonospora]MDZ5443368.1 peptidoglycan DD-metalloendopeptidase family protein [Micromonospora sp. 4G57]MDZ5488132.1 peptidoglycan DD-metalloendopeptidase family protein [Micromonospora sp. 4G53]